MQFIIKFSFIFFLIFGLKLIPISSNENEENQKETKYFETAFTKAKDAGYNLMTNLHGGAKWIFGYKNSVENEKEKEDQMVEGGGEGYFSGYSCGINFQISAQVEKMLKGIFKENGAKRVMEAFKNINWPKITKSIGTFVFGEAISELRGPFEIILRELIGGKKELIEKKFAQKSQDLRFMNALVLLVLEKLMPGGCLQWASKLYSINKISINLALKLITTLHGEWKGKEQFLVEEMEEKENDSKLMEFNFDVKNLEVQKIFYALIKMDGKKIGNLVKEAVKEELKRELSGKSIELYKFMMERMLKAIPSKVAPLWAPILLEDQIKKASNQLSTKIAPVLSKQIPNIIELISPNAKLK